MERTRNENGYQRAFLDIHAVARRYDVKRATIWAWMQQGKLPQPIRLTAGCSRWSLDDLKSWEQEKRDERAPRPQWEERERRKQQRHRPVQ